MKTTEPKINSKSEYFICTPSAQAKRLYLYANSVGHFFYEAGYFLHRDSFDSFLLINIVKGELHVKILEGESSKDASSLTVSAGQTILIDCYYPHTYFCDDSCECYWAHFDGIIARNYWNEIKNATASFICESTEISQQMAKLYSYGSTNLSSSEAATSNLLAAILQHYLQSPAERTSDKTNTSIQNIRAFIDANFDQELSLDELASLAGFSQFHFLRLFKEQTGYTPHDYIQTVRLNHASYLLKNTNQPITEICYLCGYSSPSVFTTAFKNAYGVTPREYRRL